MKLNANEFRKKLEENRKRKQYLKAAIEKRKQELTFIASAALEAALNGQYEIEISQVISTETHEYLSDIGFEVQDREIEVDSLLIKVKNISPKELQAISIRLNSELTKLIKVYPPENDAELMQAYKDLQSARPGLENEVKYLLKLISLYDVEYRVSNHLSLKVEAELWRILNKLQDIIDFYDPENDKEELSKNFLCWIDEYDDEILADNLEYGGMLFPGKLRFISNGNCDKLFLKIKALMTEKADQLQSFIKFDLVGIDGGSRISFSDSSIFDVPFNSTDLEQIFVKMEFSTAVRERIVKGIQVAELKINF